MRYPWYRKLMRHGGSLVVAIPRHIPKLWHLKAKDYVACYLDDRGRLIIESLGRDKDGNAKVPPYPHR
ncbi:MAG: hypothetical protein ACE5JN_16400 [Candidatus Methylomirabilia bacterium]